MLSSRPDLLLAMVAEFGRACAAAQRYEDLRHRGAGRGSIAPADVPRRVFEEFYSVEQTAEIEQAGAPEPLEVASPPAHRRAA